MVLRQRADIRRDGFLTGDHNGDAGRRPAFKAILLRAIAIGRRRPELKDTALRRYRAHLDRRPDRILAKPPDKPAAKKLFTAMRGDRDGLFRFVTHRDVPYTNNGCERALRSFVIFRKVTGSFRSHWGARVYAAAQSFIAPGRVNGKSALKAIGDAIAAPKGCATA